MIGPEGVGCLSDVLHRGSGNHHGVRVLDVCGTGELIVKRPLLCCDVLLQLTSRSFGHVFPHIEFSYLYCQLNSSEVLLNCIQLG